MNLPSGDKEIIRLVSRGDRHAFEQLFHKWYALLVLYARKFINDRQEAENIVQTVFIKLWEKRKDLKIKSLKAYLMIAVRNECLNELKRHHRFSQVEEKNFPNIPESEEDFPDEVLLEDIAKAIEAMPSQRKKIFKMGRFDGLKYKEIADMLGISPKTVEIQMGKALKSLREQFNPSRIEEIKKKYSSKNK